MDSAYVWLGPALLGSVGTFIGFLLKETYSAFMRKNSLAASLLAEINSICDRYYRSTKGQGVKAAFDGRQFYSLYIQEDYFTVFNNNTDKVGSFKPQEAAEIISFYIMAKGFVDTVRAWDRELSQHKEITPDIIPSLAGYIETLTGDEAVFLQHMDIARRVLEKYAHRTFWDFPCSLLKS